MAYGNKAMTSLVDTYVLKYIYIWSVSSYYMKCIFISHIITTQKLAQWAHEQKDDIGRDENYVWAQQHGLLFTKADLVFLLLPIVQPAKKKDQHWVLDMAPSFTIPRKPTRQVDYTRYSNRRIPYISLSFSFTSLFEDLDRWFDSLAWHHT